MTVAAACGDVSAASSSAEPPSPDEGLRKSRQDHSDCIRDRPGKAGPQQKANLS
eukprot:CAMPEP_0181419516 /NCGR_PEP_ID=MMETSP1110-20121109/12112_1 /TAXON_ID=174948 /ORGANISM="Symbiodinium sp., Strain CCMP421" /LENGTH=53 /DNA_ID=CAMNT_0023542531 /DNA_START=187 /DNA_END=346 /DNA_ORIENTATION=+